jgi:hypothetical protein
MSILKFNNFKSRGDIRKESNILLVNLHAALLGNISYDNRENIKKCIENIKNSNIY